MLLLGKGLDLSVDSSSMYSILQSAPMKIPTTEMVVKGKSILNIRDILSSLKKTQ